MHNVLTRNLCPPLLDIDVAVAVAVVVITGSSPEHLGVQIPKPVPRFAQLDCSSHRRGTDKINNNGDRIIKHRFKIDFYPIYRDMVIGLT